MIYNNTIKQKKTALWRDTHVVLITVGQHLVPDHGSSDRLLAGSGPLGDHHDRQLYCMDQ